MKKNLHLTDDLAFPPDIVTRKTVVYGLNGMGKSNLTLGSLPEELNRVGLRFCIMDLMGVAWGLQHGSKKGQNGIDVLILGGPHGDIEIEPTAGAVVADLVADESVSTIIDMSRQKSGKGWSKGDKIRFHADFYLRLYERQAETRRPLLVIQDEAARVIPQTIPYGSPDLAKCVGAIETMAEEGRALGVGMVFVTPRSARLNKSVAELAETMIAFRTVGPNSVGAVMDWLGQHVEKARHKEIVEKLRSLPVGSALVVSPGWLNHEGIVRFNMRGTFDSTKTPEPGVEVHAPGEATKPDLEKYRERMKATIEKAKATDPKELQEKVRRLQAKIKQLETNPMIQVAEPKLKIVEKPVLRAGELDRLEKVLERALKHMEKTLTAHKEVSDLVSKINMLVHEAKKPLEFTKANGKPAQLNHGYSIKIVGHAGTKTTGMRKEYAVEPIVGEAADEDAKGLGPAHTKIINAIARLNQLGINPATREEVAIYAGMHPSGGYYARVVGEAKTAGLVAYPTNGRLCLTDAGAQKARAEYAIQTNEALQADVCQRAGPAHAKIINALIAAYPDALSREEAATAAGMDAGGGYYARVVGETKTMGVVTYPDKGQLRAADILFAVGR